MYAVHSIHYVTANDEVGEIELLPVQENVFENEYEKQGVNRVYELIDQA